MIGIDAALFVGLVVHVLGYFDLRPAPYLYAVGFTPMALVFLVVVLLIGYIALGLRRRSDVGARLAIVAATGVMLIGSYLGIQVLARSRTAVPYVYIHDGAVQTEDAIAALRRGQNPYAYDYRQSTFVAFPESFSGATRPNPAWTHYVYPPLHVVLGVPAAWIADRLHRRFDVRLLYAAAFVIFAASAAAMAKGQRRLVVLVLALFNPAFLPFFLSGFNDILFLAFVALGFFLLSQHHESWGSAAFGLACAAKQTAWPLVLLLIIYVWLTRNGVGVWRSLWRRVGPAVGVAAAVVLPFFLWSPSAFIDDVLRFGTGSAQLSYPVSGLGLSQLLLSIGAIRSMWDYYPFWILQAVIGLPLFIGLAYWMRRQPTLDRLLISYAALAFALLFSSRYFNDSYLGVFSMILLLAYAVGRQQTEPGAAVSGAEAGVA